MDRGDLVPDTVIRAVLAEGMPASARSSSGTPGEGLLVEVEATGHPEEVAARIPGELERPSA
jgi:hypothetical protein